MRNPPALLSSKRIRSALVTAKHVSDMEMGDAIEAYEDIMELLHSASSGSLFTSEDAVLPDYHQKDCERPCLAHSLFGILKKASSLCCTCGEVKESTDSLWHFPVVVSQLLDTAYTPLGLHSILQKQMKMNAADQHCTCDNCEKRGARCEVVLSEEIARSPPLFVVSLVNASSTQSSSTIKALLKAILAPSPPFTLQSFICYRGFHYVCVCQERGRWLEYSDGSAIVFPNEESMIESCIECSSLPVLLFFSQTAEDSIDVEFAQETLDSLQPNSSENLDSRVSMRDDAQEGGLFSSVANSIQSLFRDETNPMTVVCLHCGNSSMIDPDVLLCPKCHQPLP
ncbi:hypothetical protein WA577_000132 [Blastocystis sp. JDR]